MRTTLILLALALVAGAALAAGPYTKEIEADTGTDFYVLADTLGYSHARDVQVYFADADVDVIYWTWDLSDSTRVRLNNDDGTNSYADADSWVPAGLVERPDWPVKAVTVIRDVSTSGVIKWFK